jgi:hypothetical protein
MALYCASGLSVKKFAFQVAQKNEQLPWKERLGTGSTIPDAIEKQVRREKLRMGKDGDYRYDVEYFRDAIVAGEEWAMSAARTFLL